MSRERLKDSIYGVLTLLRRRALVLTNYSVSSSDLELHARKSVTLLQVEMDLGLISWVLLVYHRDEDQRTKERNDVRGKPHWWQLYVLLRWSVSYVCAGYIVVVTLQLFLFSQKMSRRIGQSDRRHRVTEANRYRSTRTLIGFSI